MLKIEIVRNALDDIHNSMSWWACFKKFASENFQSNLGSSNHFSSKPKTKTKKKKKKKRKMAKKSRRKNR